MTIPAVSLATTSPLHLGPAPFHLVYGLRPPWFLLSRCVHLLLRGSGCCVHVRGRPEVSNHPWLLWSRGEMAMSLARWLFLLRSRRSWREVLLTGSVSLLFINSLFRVSFKESVWASRQTKRRDCIVSPGHSLVRCSTTHQPYFRFEVALRRSTCSWPATSTSDGVASNADCYAVFGPATSKYRSTDVRLQLNDSGRSFARILSLTVNSQARLVCHCLPSQACHGDKIVEEYRARFPAAFDRDAEGPNPPSAEVLNYMARLREKAASESDTSADEGAPPRSSGWVGSGAPLMIGSGYTRREVCDGLSLASPGRWTPSQRRYPQNAPWLEIAAKVRDYTRREGPPELLMKLALGRISSCPFNPESIAALKEDIVSALAKHGQVLKSELNDRTDLPIDYRFLELLLGAAEDPEHALGQFAQG